MKIYAFLITFSVLLNMSCHSQKLSHKDENLSAVQVKKYDIDKIKLREQSRGISRSFVFSAYDVSATVNGETIKSEISAENWKNITEQAKRINLSEISSYSSSTTGRFSDKALSSTIVITSGKQVFESSSFDEKIPPKELEGLYQLLKNKTGKINPKRRFL